MKPQFEAGRDRREEGHRARRGGASRRLRGHEGFVASLGFTCSGSIPSPIEGGDGNREFLLGPAVAEHVIIKRLGAEGRRHRGDTSGPVFVPNALPGETVTIERATGARASRRDRRSRRPIAQMPFCPYFGDCGGCATQHMRPAFYRAWKRGIVADALQPGAARCAGRAARRRPWRGPAALDAACALFRRRPCVGYMAARSHAVVEIDLCPIAEPGLARRRPPSRAPSPSASHGPRKAPRHRPDHARAKTGSTSMCAGTGPSRTRDRVSADRSRDRPSISRVCRSMATIVVARPRAVLHGRPGRPRAAAGRFLQATRAGEEALVGLVLEACAAPARRRSLLPAAGAFACASPRTRRSHAVENDKASVAALDKRGARDARPAPRRGEARDLFRRPLLVPELNGLRRGRARPAPRRRRSAGQQLAAAKVPLVVSVSCDAGTFARDAAILMRGRLPAGTGDADRPVQILAARGGRRGAAAGRGEEAAVIQTSSRTERQRRSGIAFRTRRQKPSAPLWGRAGEGAAPDWNQQTASTPLPGPPPQGGRGIAPHPAHNPGSASRSGTTL